jgi:hypothetical protein
MDAYNRVLQIINRLNPSSKLAEDCYARVVKLIEKIEGRFSEAQRNQWEMEKKRAANTAELSKEIVKAMGKISSSYQPGQASTVIIAK